MRTVSDIVREELYIPTVKVNAEMTITSIVRADNREVDMQDVRELARIQNISVLQAFYVIMSEAHSMNFIRQNTMRLEYLDSLSAAGRSARYDVEVLDDENNVTAHLIGEHITSIIMRYDSLMVRVNDGSVG